MAALSEYLFMQPNVEQPPLTDDGSFAAYKDLEFQASLIEDEYADTFGEDGDDE